MDIGKLDTFYRATTFFVYHPNGQNIPIRVGQYHPALDEILPPNCESWSFLTACNPRSEVLTDMENAERMQVLLQDVARSGHKCWSGLGVSDSSDWKPENSIFVLGMSCEEATIAAERYDQNAFVYGERGKQAELLWTRERL